MESLLEKLSSFDVTQHPNNPNAEHPRYALYKSKKSGSSQEERRRNILEARKEARYDLLNHLRSIEENVKDENDITSDDMNVDAQRGVYRKPRKYRNFLMLSEWLVDAPQDFVEKYIAVPCPIGKRCLCVAYKGSTKVFSKNGACLKLFSSLLPGGSSKTKRFGNTVLDCIWSEVNQIFYILDMMFWYRYSYIECETVFRLEWLKSRVKEFDEDVTVISSLNKFRFLPVPFYECDKDSLGNMFSDPLVDRMDLDGILFYHKENHYTHGPSPLVCWLKPFMLEDILGIFVPSKYLSQRPSNYSSIADHIEAYNSERKDLIKQRKNEHKIKKGPNEHMEVVCPPVSELPQEKM